MKKPSRLYLRGFTLIEILITIVILAILAGITLVALNPGQNIDDANDARRKADVSALLNAIWQYTVANDGIFPVGITTTVQEMSNSGANICSDLVTTYIAALPSDPTTGSYTSCASYATGYTVNQDASGNRITIGATLSDSSTYTQAR